MDHWFTNYEGSNWNPGHGYNKMFANEVRRIRETHALSKERPGLDINRSNKWIRFVSRLGDVAVKVNSFNWLGYTEEEGMTKVTFKLEIEFARVPTEAQGKPSFFDRIFGWDKKDSNKPPIIPRPFLQETLEMRFPFDYPLRPPLMRTSTAKERLSGSDHDFHEHHCFSNGWMCVMDGEKDWNPVESTAVTALGVAMEWILFHHDKFGW